MREKERERETQTSAVTRSSGTVCSIDTVVTALIDPFDVTFESADESVVVLKSIRSFNLSKKTKST